MLVTEAEGAGEKAANFSVDAFHFPASEPGLVMSNRPGARTCLVSANL
jgi:hypothetical protein